jgi:type IV fimbrial biogenesis protein FimT
VKFMPLKRQSGFSLLELVTTLAIAAVLTAAAYPSMRDFMRRNRVISESNSIQADLQLARGQAAATRSYVSVCPLANPGVNVCDTAGTNYNKGWLVFTTTAPSTGYDASSTSNVLQHVGAAAGNTTIVASIGGVITYNARGELLITAADEEIFKTCFLLSGSSTGMNTNTVPGIQMNVGTSGRIASNKLSAGSSCN